MRFLSAVFIAVSFFIARYDISIIVTLMSLSWGVVAGSFMAPYLYGLYWKRTTLAGAKAGMFTGLLLAIGLFYYLGPANSPIASSIAMIAPFIVVPLVSLFTKPPQQTLIDKAFANI
jgi:solute:Na+ symporter, SSS family